MFKTYTDFVQWPTHKDTTCGACQDSSRRGARCYVPLSEMIVVYEEAKGECDECREKKGAEEEF